MESESGVREVLLVGGPPWGLRLGAVTAAELPAAEEGEEGRVVGAIKIARVNPTGIAANAGLRDGDLILSVNGHPVQAPGTSAQEGSGSENVPSTSSQSPSQEQQHKVMSVLQQNDKVNLSVLSKKSKSSKKLEKALAKGEAEKRSKEVTSAGREKTQVASSVRWADEHERDQMNGAASSNDTQTDSTTNDVPFGAVNSQDASEKGREIEDLKAGQEIREPPSISSPTLLSDIIDELQLAATTTAKFLSEMEAHLQEELDKMQPEQGLLQISSSSTAPPIMISTNSAAPSGPPAVPPKPSQFIPSALLTKQEDLEQIKPKEDDTPIPPVWTPPGMPPSPKLGKKFRPVNFNASQSSSVPSSPQLTTTNPVSFPTPQSPDVNAISILSPPSEKSLSASNSFDNSVNSVSLSKQSISLSSTTTSSNLPKYQSPTVVLLQKAREGHLPKGAAYLEQQQHNHQSGTSFQSISEPVIRSYAESSPVSRNPRKGFAPEPLVNVPMTSKSTLSDEKDQREWYRKMYESLHVERRASGRESAKCSYPAGRIRDNGPPARSFWARKTHSNGTMSEPEDFDHPDEEIYDFNKFGGGTVPPPGAIRFTNPGKIEDYNPITGASSSISVRKQRYLRMTQPEYKKHWALASPKLSGYESDTNYIIRKRESENGMKSPEPCPLSPAEQKHLYADIQKGGDVPLQGLRKIVPGPGPRDLAYDDQGDGRIASPSQNIRYNESTVNIHYRLPVRFEEKEYVAEEELRRRQQLAMKRFYEEQRRLKFMKELEDMESRRHSDNFIPSQKSPIPLNRYEDGEVFDGLIDNTPARPGSAGLWHRMTPEPVTPSGKPLALARAKFNFNAQSPKELQLTKGDLVVIRKKIDNNWYDGELRMHKGKGSYFYPSNGSASASGIFPCTYVELLPEDPTAPGALAKYSAGNRPQESEGFARALYNFRATHHFELDLLKGETIILTKRVDANWYEGRKQKSPQMSGIFPVSYVDVIRDIGSNVKSPGAKKPVGQPVAHSLSYASDTDDIYSMKKHHYKPNDFILQDESDYGEVFSPIPMKNERHRKSKNQKRLELITVDTQIHNENTYRYRALYNYKPVNRDELELREGDIIEVFEKCDDGWYVGTSQRTGVFGTFPGNYVERV